MKKILSICAALVFAVSVYAQEGIFRPRLEITEIEINDGEEELEVFKMENDGHYDYFLSVGHLGIGDRVVQVYFDPIFELFIPLGSSLTEAIETLQQLKDFAKQPKNSTMEVQGCLAAAVPTDARETVTITARRVFFAKKLMFSVEREGYTRATYVSRMNMGSLVNGTKLYKAIHPKEL
jgi:hypothetical protein